MSYMDRINQCQELVKTLRQERENVKSRYPHWADNDVRITIFSKYINVSEAAHLGMIFYHKFIMRPEWWSENFTSSQPVTEQDIDIRAQEYNRFIKNGFQLQQYSTIESSIRQIMRTLEPTRQNSGNFFPRCEHLFTRLGLQRYIPLIKLLNVSRNTVHNNGVHFHQSGNNNPIPYNGVTYTFTIGQPTAFSNWSFVLDRSLELVSMLVAIVNAPDISSLPQIADPFTL